MAKMPNKALVFLEEVTKTPFFELSRYLIPSIVSKTKDRVNNLSESLTIPLKFLFDSSDKKKNPIWSTGLACKEGVNL
ncbi:MAG: hypothetical protein H7177_05115 [Rhizobacter sp.]|nr:hypothetical protein [Bacteriovorax sp.]